MHYRFTLRSLVLATALVAGVAHAQTVKVQDAWARATVPGQTASGAFMRLTAPEHLSLVGVQASVAGVAEVHEMAMKDGVMSMKAMPSLDLPANQMVQLKPGGYHVMLMDLKAPLVKGSEVKLRLDLKTDKGQTVHQDIHVPVRLTAPGADGAHDMPAGMHMQH